MEERQIAGAPVSPPQLQELLARWVGDGLITAEQASLIAARESLRRAAPGRLGPPPAPAVAEVRRRRLPLVTEGLGYLGGVLIVVATALVSARYWADLPLGVRLGLVAAAAVLLLAAGAVVPDRLGDVAVRLRAVLWALSTAAFAGLLGLVGADALDWTDGADIALLVGLGTAAYAGVLYWRQRGVLQQAALFAALATAAAAAAAHLNRDTAAAPGLAVWALGGAWLVLAWRGAVRPRWTGLALGSVGALFGAQATMTAGWGYFLALATVGALIGAGVLLGDLLLLGVGAFGALQVLPATVLHFFPGALAAPLALLAGGIVLVVVAVWVARRGRDGTGGRPRTGATRHA